MGTKEVIKTIYRLVIKTIYRLVIKTTLGQTHVRLINGAKNVWS